MTTLNPPGQTTPSPPKQTTKKTLHLQSKPVPNFQLALKNKTMHKEIRKTTTYSNSTPCRTNATKTRRGFQILRDKVNPLHCFPGPQVAPTLSASHTAQHFMATTGPLNSYSLSSNHQDQRKSTRMEFMHTQWR